MFAKRGGRCHLCLREGRGHSDLSQTLPFRPNAVQFEHTREDPIE